MRNKLSCILLTFGMFCHAQQWQLITEIHPGAEITAVSTDSRNMFYIGTSSGSVIRYSAQGEEDEYYSELNNAAVTNIQSWNRMKNFVFFRDPQTTAILDRFTTTPKFIDLGELKLDFSWLFAPGIDHSFWALSTGYRELIKYDDQNLNMLFRIVLPEAVEIEAATCLRAFKNMLIISDQITGLYVFDQFGKLHGHLNEPGIVDLQIENGEIVTTNGLDFLRINPFELRIIEKIKAPVGAFTRVVTTGDRYIFFSEGSAHIYELN